MKFSLFFCLPFVLGHAYFNGNPESADIIDEGFILSKENIMSFEVGYQKDWVYDLKLNVENIFDSWFSRANYVMDQAVFNVDFLEYFQAYATMGAATFDFIQEIKGNTTVNYITNDGFTFGAGGKVLIYQGHGFTLGVDGKYQYANPDIKTTDKNGINQTVRNASMSVYGWQIGLAAAYHVDIFSPYLGINYLNQKVHLKNLGNLVTPLDDDVYAENRVPIGGFIGVTISSGKDFAMTLESRFIDENALSLVFDFKF